MNTCIAYIIILLTKLYEKVLLKITGNLPLILFKLIKPILVLGDLRKKQKKTIELFCE